MNVFVLYTSFITFHFIVSHTFTAHSPSCQNNLRRSSRREMCPCPLLEVGKMWRILIHTLLELLSCFSDFIQWQGGSSEKMVVLYILIIQVPLSFFWLLDSFLFFSFLYHSFKSFMILWMRFLSLYKSCLFLLYLCPFDCLSLNETYLIKRYIWLLKDVHQLNPHFILIEKLV